MSAIAPQHTADFGNGGVDARRYFAGEFPQLQIVCPAEGIRADFGPRRFGSLQPRDRTLEACNGFFELIHFGGWDSGSTNRADRSAGLLEFP
jgi:hypothetical protein